MGRSGLLGVLVAVAVLVHGNICDDAAEETVKIGVGVDGVQHEQKHNETGVKEIIEQKKDDTYVIDVEALKAGKAADLLALERIFHDGGGDSWAKSTGWIESQDPCTGWHMVTCNGVGRVTGIDLFYNNIGGAIPDAVGDLSELMFLGLGSNNLKGNITASICKLKRLEYLDLSGNELEGDIPECFGGLQYMTDMYLYANKLSGPIPPSLGTLPYLEYIDVSSNDLEKMAEGIRAIPTLRVGYFFDNRFTDPLDSVFHADADVEEETEGEPEGTDESEEAPTSGRISGQKSGPVSLDEKPDAESRGFQFKGPSTDEDEYDEEPEELELWDDFDPKNP